MTSQRLVDGDLNGRRLTRRDRPVLKADHRKVEDLFAEFEAAQHTLPLRFNTASTSTARKPDYVPSRPEWLWQPAGMAVARQDQDALIGCALHQHKLHLSEVYGLRRDQTGCILFKNDGLVFHEGE